MKKNINIIKIFSNNWKNILIIFIVFFSLFSFFTSSNKASAYAIGDSFEGGKIAYIFQSGDSGYESGATKILIAAPYDQSTLSSWSISGPCSNTDISGANGTALATGRQNTLDILAVPSCGNAAQVVNDININGYTDWYLPSQDEMNKLVLNRVAIGGFDSTKQYWSSTETSSTTAYYGVFNGGSSGTNSKAATYSVRAVRLYSSRAIAPSSIILSDSISSSVGGVTNVAIPVADATDTTGAITGFRAGIDNRIKLTVTDVSPSASTITIGGSAYSSGTDYTIAPGTSSLSIVVTTTETGKETAVRTFIVSVAAWTMTVGSKFEGGKIAYILQPGDPGYIADGVTRGLIAAVRDQGYSAAWGCSGGTYGASGTALGTGSQNTTNLLAGCGNIGIAAKIARAYDGGGYNDWYLPSQDELHKLYLNRVAIGGFDTTKYYWSSTENSATYAYMEQFDGTNNKGAGNKTTTLPVRAVRSFSSSKAIAPSSIVLGFGSFSPVGNINNVFIPEAGFTDMTGMVKGWVAGTANKIKFTVIDTAPAVSTITIDGGAYTSGVDYIVTSTSSLSIIVTTTETGKTTTTRGFIIRVASTTYPSLSIGDNFEGGKVAYILQVGDPGYEVGAKKGLIAAINDQSPASSWGATSPCSTTDIAGAAGIVLGTGPQNTHDMIAASCKGAATLIDNVNINGYTDWYLPSQDELSKLYLNKVAIGGFNNSYYWSSTESSASDGLIVNFNGNNTSTTSKTTAVFSVRAVRSFSTRSLAPSNVQIEVGNSFPVSRVTNVVIPVDGATDTTGEIKGWISGTADRIKFTVTDVSPSTSTITINGSAYASGTEYIIPSASTLTVVVTTTEIGKDTAVRTFTIPVTAWSLSVGNMYQGGKVAYILQAGDPGYVADGVTRGLVAALNDQSVGVSWNSTASGSVTTGTAIGTGLANTNNIIASQGTSYAAGVARAYSGGGYSDWYLPSKDELNKLYLNQVAIGGFNIHSFDDYWSSSQCSTDGAFIQAFYAGSVACGGKDSFWYVRAVRSFVYSEAIAPSSIVLTLGTSSPVESVTNVAIPASGGIDNTGRINGWISGSADRIKFTVTDTAPATSTITINGSAYTSGSDYIVPSTTTLNIVVTTTEAGKDTVIRIFTIPVTAWTMAVGATYGGGKIAYIFKSGDIGYISDGITRGLIAATADQSTSASWGCQGSVISGADGTLLGTGSQNTTEIMTGCGTAGIAARVARAYTGSGYNDWHLPSKDELNKLYLNRVAIKGFNTSSGVYFSSSEASTNFAWAQNFYDGTQSGTNFAKSAGYYVRPVRIFSASLLVPSSVVLAAGNSSPVGGIINVYIPEAGDTDMNGIVTGWATGSADKIKFTVTDTAPATSSITINNSVYTNGADYTIAPGVSLLTIKIVTTSAGQDAAVRTFSIKVTSLPLYIFSIGDIYDGGKIAYILQSGDPGYDSNVQKGLITPLNDSGSSISWGCYGSAISGADGTLLGTGSQNTTEIINGCADIEIAAKVARAYIGGGHSDWYLPSKDELNQLYINRATIGQLNVTGMEVYYSSSEASANFPWTQYFYSGIQQNNNFIKSGLHSVRAVRSFVYNGVSIPFPTLNTQASNNITTSSATILGEIVNNGSELNDKRGIVYGTVSRANPGNVTPASTSYPNNIETLGSYLSGTFSFGMTGLTENTIYYVRAYSHNSSGYSYGNEIFFRANTSKSRAGTITSLESGATPNTTQTGGNKAGGTYIETPVAPATPINNGGNKGGGADLE